MAENLASPEALAPPLWILGWGLGPELWSQEGPLAVSLMVLHPDVSLLVSTVPWTGSSSRWEKITSWWLQTPSMEIPSW